MPSITIGTSFPTSDDLRLYLAPDSLHCLAELYEALGNEFQWSGLDDTLRLNGLKRLSDHPAFLDIPGESYLGAQQFSKMVMGYLPDSLDDRRIIRELCHTLLYGQLIRSALYGTLPAREDALSFCKDSAVFDIMLKALGYGDAYEGMLASLPGSVGERIGWMYAFRDSADLDWPGYKIPACRKDSAECLEAARLALQSIGMLSMSDSLSDSTAFYAALRAFQVRNGLSPDGVLGSLTIKAFAKSNQERLEQLYVNLERARQQASWETGSCYIEVNVPEMVLRFYKDGHVISKHRVVVGLRKGNQTPSFHAMMTKMVVNPEWIVPYSIATKEILPDQKADPSYISRHHYKVLSRDGHIVDPASVDWSNLSVGHFPYRIVQKAGSFNALGSVKFLFPNSHQVYIHDTPSKKLFQREQRDFSHGCIRVEDPHRLALHILENSDAQVDSTAFHALLDTTLVHSIPIRPGIPVIIDYCTVRQDEASGLLIFFDDIYGLDSKRKDPDRSD